jgi:hypothetical protein
MTNRDKISVEFNCDYPKMFHIKIGKASVKISSDEMKCLAGGCYDAMRMEKLFDRDG